jgi:aquaporin Z
MKGNLYLAEVIGTFTLVFAGCGAIVVNDTSNQVLGHVVICLVFGLVVMAMIYSVGNISGAHLNPAVTLGFLFARRLEMRAVLPYIASQAAGAVAAGLALRMLFPGHESLGATLPSITFGRAFAVEVLLSFILMFVILNVSTGHMEKGIMAGIAVGGTVALDALFGGTLTGASMNPARSLGPAIACGNIESLWIYLTAPVAGTFLAHPTCRWIQGTECCAVNEQDKAGQQ